MTILRRRNPVDPSRRGLLVLLRLFLLTALACGGLYAAEAAALNAPATFQQHCFACHNDASATAGVNLEKLTSEPSIGDSFKQWQKVAAEIEHGRMPPAPMPQPSDAERNEAAQWIRTSLNTFAEKHDGEPGRVTVRRLTSGEYGYTVRDLTGLDLDIEKHFADDAVGGEGFTNFGDVQFMADANLESYLAAAKKIADHAVIGAGPLDFFGDPGMSGFELSAIHRIQDIYREHGFRAVAAEGGRAFGLERYGKAFYVAWQYRHRKALGLGAASLEELGARQGLSPRFVEHIWSVVQQPSPSYPTSEVVSRWQDLPVPADSAADTERVRAACTEIQQFVINWPRRLFAAGDLAAGGAGDERALVITDASLAASAKQRLKLVALGRDQAVDGVYLSIVSVNPESAGTPVVVWRNATVQFLMTDRQRLPEQPLVEVLTPETIERLGLGQHPRGDGSKPMDPSDFITEGETTVFLKVNLPEGARGLALEVDVEVDLDRSADTVVRLLMSDSEEGSRGRPTWALLADPTGEGFQTWKANVLDYAANLPQTSHGEATPSDRDPIPEPFDNTYNQQERNRFHFRVKYFRQDQFLVDKMLDDRTRRKLDQAWTDLQASFEYHDAFLDFVEDKYDLDLDGKGIADLDAATIAALPAEPRKYVSALRQEYAAVQAAQMEGRQQRLDESIEFASRAWRRPLTDLEKDRLRSFYTAATEDFGLDHRKAIRALLARILVSPAFLYRLEPPAEAAAAAPLSDWELAGRMSYFLWSSLPDRELRRAAAAGELSDPNNLKRQVQRMLADPKARRFATEFFGQWLGFYRFDRYRGVDSKRFPEFTDDIKSAMYDEAVSFFEHVLRQDRPVMEIISADYTFLNQALAKHYGVEKEIASTGAAELVQGAGGFHRGGLLRLGAVLTATSAPLRTSPVKRGDWVLRRVVGTPTPPPPPDAGSLPADDKAFEGRTAREQLEVHKRNPTCAACHTRIDPLGFPLEHYDAIGRWRNEYEDGQAIDDSTKLRDQTEIAGIEGLVDYVATQERQVLLTLSHKLLGYALGRTVLASDLALVDRLTTAGGDVTFRELASIIITSKQFRYRSEKEGGTLAAAESAGGDSPAAKLDD